MNIFNSAALEGLKGITTVINIGSEKKGNIAYGCIIEESSGFSELKKKIEPDVNQRCHTLYPHLYFLELSILNAFDPKFSILMVECKSINLTFPRSLTFKCLNFSDAKSPLSNCPSHKRTHSCIPI